MFSFLKNKSHVSNEKINVTTKSLKKFLKSKGIINCRLMFDHQLPIYYMGECHDNFSDIINALNAKYIGNVNKEYPVFRFNYNGIKCYLRHGDFIDKNRIYVKTKLFDDFTKI